MKNKKYWEGRYKKMLENGNSGSMTLDKTASTYIFEEEIQKLIPQTKNGAVLDYGCGAGKKIDVVLKLFVPDQYVGYDEISCMVEYCKNVHKGNNVKFVKKLTRGKYDIIWMSNVIQHMDTEEAIEKLISLSDKLTKKGKMIITDYQKEGLGNEYMEFRGEESHIKLFENAGLKCKLLGVIDVKGAPIGVWELKK